MRQTEKGGDGAKWEVLSEFFLIIKLLDGTAQSLVLTGSLIFAALVWLLSCVMMIVLFL